MFKRAFAGAAILISFSLPLAAETKDVVEEVYEETIPAEDLRLNGATDAGHALTLARPDLFAARNGSFLLHGAPTLTLLDGRRFAASDFGGMGVAPLDIFPVAFLRAVEVQKAGPSLRHGADYAGGAVDFRLKRYHYGGEVGFFYGSSTGKYGREDFSTHIIGGVGNDKFNVTAGVFYHESNVRIPPPRGR